MPLQPKLTRALLELIRIEREGQSIQTNLVSDVIDCFFFMGEGLEGRTLYVFIYIYSHAVRGRLFDIALFSAAFVPPGCRLLIPLLWNIHSVLSPWLHGPRRAYRDRSVSMKIYTDFFENEFIAETESFYERESEAFIAANPVTEYMRKVCIVNVVAG